MPCLRQLEKRGAWYAGGCPPAYFFDGGIGAENKILRHFVADTRARIAISRSFGFSRRFCSR